MGAWRDFAADVRRYRNPERQNDVYLLFAQGLWALAAYRFGHWAVGIKTPILGRLFRILAFALFKAAEIITGISIAPTAKIAGGFYVGHFGYTLVHPDAIIGKGCSIGPGVIVGAFPGAGKPGGGATLGDDVYVGSGVKIIGPVTIGSRAKIGANSVVLHDVPEGATVVGIPARIVHPRRSGISAERPPDPGASAAVIP